MSLLRVNTSQIAVWAKAAVKTPFIPSSLLLVGAVAAFSTTRISAQSDMEDINAIANNVAKHATTGEQVLYKSFWEEDTVVINFFRRFG